MITLLIINAVNNNNIKLLLSKYFITAEENQINVWK